MTVDIRWYKLRPGDERKLRKAFGRQWSPLFTDLGHITEDAILTRVFPPKIEFLGAPETARHPFTSVYPGPCFAPLIPLPLAESFDACGFRGYTAIPATALHSGGLPPTQARLYLSAIRTDLVLRHMNHTLYPMDHPDQRARGALRDYKGRIVVHGEPLRGLDAARPNQDWTTTELVSSRVKLWAQREGQVHIDFVPVDLVIDGELVKHEDLPDAE